MPEHKRSRLWWRCFLELAVSATTAAAIGCSTDNSSPHGRADDSSRNNSSTEQNYPEGWIVVDHVIPGVTTEMLDWWWVNMEKGYELWCPDEHKSFRWEVKPPAGGHIGAVQIATESIDYGPVIDLPIEWLDPNLGTQEQKDFWTYDHLLTAGSPGAAPNVPPSITLSHQYEAIPGGSKMRSCLHVPPGMTFDPDAAAPDAGAIPPHPSGKTPTGGGWRSHNIAEASAFNGFLPALWKMWQTVPDPTINRQCSLRTKKEASQIIYTNE